MFSTTEITSGEIHSDNVIHQRLLYAYVEAAKLVSGSILEVGCGFGRGLELFKDKCEHYSAVDKNETLINKLASQYKDFTFKSGNVPPFPFEDNSFDFLVSFQVIEHIKDDHLFLKEVKRVLKPGGKAIISTPNKSLSLTRNPWHIREYTAQEFTTICNKYFSNCDAYSVDGNQKVTDYYEKNKASVRKITRFDIFNLQYNLPRFMLQVPYDYMNRRNRKKLMNGNQNLVADVSTDDYHLSKDPAKGYDLFYILEK